MTAPAPYRPAIPSAEAAALLAQLSRLCMQVERLERDHPSGRQVHYQMTDLIDGLRRASKAADHMTRGAHYPEWIAAMDKTAASLAAAMEPGDDVPDVCEDWCAGAVDHEGECPRR